MNNRINYIARIGIFTALALIMYFVESMFPPVIPLIPYAKIGLSNVVSFLALIMLGFNSGLIIVVLKCFLGSLFTGNIFALAFSLSGGIMSYFAMFLLYKYAYKHMSLTGISIVGALVHNITQVIVACLMIKNVFTVIILPYMLAFSLVAGVITGLTVYYVVKNLPIEKFENSLYAK
ncbi:MAG: Gx transporter family protein [Clostridia bacterium]|jgi:heptaprenyl diphosphate synthase|nr:Gx transporter family protein [Clostridia bacterium]MDD4275667.1 Gx transporter family protein [Clostridia bacterium]